MPELETLGWRPFFADQVGIGESRLIPARVIRQDGSGLLLATTDGNWPGTITGRSRFASQSKADLPSIGDWVLTEWADPQHTSLVIRRVLDRSSRFSRKEAGMRTDEQVVAANIDTVFIVCGLDDNFSPQRVERYLLLANRSGADPVIVLTKLDLCDDIGAALAAIRNVAPGTPVCPVSTVSGEGVEVVEALLTPGSTSVLLGSSGVGKSTLINYFIGEAYFETGAVRDGDSKGRHTTTHRELIATPSGALIIDTPGMRELQLWSDEETLAETYDDVDAFAMRCKFSDCAHDGEPGCAVQAAIDGGELEQARLDSYLKLQREIRQLAVRQDALAKAEEKRGRKRFAKLVRNRPDKRD